MRLSLYLIALHSLNASHRSWSADLTINSQRQWRAAEHCLATVGLELVCGVVLAYVRDVKHGEVSDLVYTELNAERRTNREPTR